MTRHSGFRFVELLVVLAILALALIVLLPGVQFAREIARRTMCGNHLKQLALGFHSHHDALRALPHGGIDNWECTPRLIDGTGARLEQQWAGWGYQVLPYIDQQEVFDGGENSEASDDARRIFAIGTSIPTMYCPTRRPPKAHPAIASWYPVDPNRARLGAPGTYPHAQTDYASAYVDPFAAGRNIGTGSLWIVTEDISRSGAVVRLGLRRGTTGEHLPDPARNLRSAIPLIELTDGASNVILLGEKRLNVFFISQYQSDDNEGYTSGWDHDVNRNASQQPLPDLKAASGDGNQRFGSSHPGGFQVVMGDGAVKFIPFNVNELLFHRLGCRNDGQAASVPAQ